MKHLVLGLLFVLTLALPSMAQFGSQQVITTNADYARSVFATDLDGDGDADVLSASFYDNKIAWYENLSGGAFGSQQVITNAADGAQCVFATDLDGDGDQDVLSASFYDDKIAWYENQHSTVIPPETNLFGTGCAGLQLDSNEATLGGAWAL